MSDDDTREALTALRGAVDDLRYSVVGLRDAVQECRDLLRGALAAMEADRSARDGVPMEGGFSTGMVDVSRGSEAHAPARPLGWAEQVDRALKMSSRKMGTPPVDGLSERGA